VSDAMKKWDWLSAQPVGRIALLCIVVAWAILALLVLAALWFVR
jgi:hypothetical protein